MTIDNLWLKPIKTEFTPISVLKEQAKYLANTSNYKFVAKIITSYPEDETAITVAFYIVAKELRGYNYRLLWFDQPIDTIFPFKIKAFSSPVQDFGVVNNMEEFVQTIGKVLGSLRTATILGNILTIGNAVKINDQD